ncbi:MAG: (2Fe-2S)-binding protein [Candidatus Dormibacteria bacterium]
MSAKQRVALTVNGVPFEEWVDPRLLLADFLRDNLDMVGVHVGCEHGVCGACTVLMNGESIRSCITLAVQADGAEIMTIEGLAAGDQLHPIQAAFRDEQALQCGFCTPGMILRGYEILRENPHPTAMEVREAISGNLCRCTGYQSIIAAIMAAGEKMAAPPDLRVPQPVEGGSAAEADDQREG